MKESKGGLVTFLFLNGKDKDGIAKELKDAFKVSDEQALKITRRITGQTRFFHRALELTAAKQAANRHNQGPSGDRGAVFVSASGSRSWRQPA